ncbi:MAG: alpha/beta fold hydrolase [Spirochaetales bacterium]|uniref:Alpha/beta fold hydrolase n=1 Tax=Candidatus Thalassospirochaeta sargassi TaxID=3119039 RepID=A0AAJ1MIC8_9SPIO|nr:alpha/beta fold hydrolase [Spirochaetales bacterium]
MKNYTKVLKTALPLHLEGTNGKAVIIQHGYNGYPAEMYGLAERLNKEGYTVLVPRLPGHATSGADFRKTNWKLWTSHFRNEYMNLNARYDSVSIAAVSMGCLLALMTAAEFEPEKLILLAPALAVKQKIVYSTPLLRWFVPVITRKRAPEPEAGEDRLYMEREYWSHYYSAQLASFTKIMRKARRILNDVDCPVYYMLSETDGTVPLEVGRMLDEGLRRPAAGTHVLKNSPHVFFEGPENEFVLDKVVDWMAE